MDAFEAMSLPFAAVVFAVLAGVVLVLAAATLPVLEREGLYLFVGSEWSPGREVYGVLPALLGTVYVSLLASLIAIPLSLGFVAFTFEYAPPAVSGLLQSFALYAASVPTVLFGLWGLEYVVPAMRALYLPLLCKGSATGHSVLAAAVVLALMNSPYASVVIGEAYRSIPFAYREALYSLGARGFERFKVSWGFLRGAVVGALLLCFGKCVGETTAVSMVVGNAFRLALCPLEPGITVSSLIVNYVGEAALYDYMSSALFGAALAMLALNSALVFAGTWLAGRARGW